MFFSQKRKTTEGLQTSLQIKIGQKKPGILQRGPVFSFCKENRFMRRIIFIFVVLFSFKTWSQHESHKAQETLSRSEFRWMLHVNAFLVQSFQEGPRGDNEFFAPNMFMGDFGTNATENQFVNVNMMLTAERWTYPDEGAPQLLQVGELNEDDEPYIDHQHPHSSPIMGLTFSDTINFDKNFLKIFFAPRGEATEGPQAFMHRITGQINSEPPLGHHVGQDVAHITSTVLGASLKLDRVTYEASAFHGREPSPTETDIPMGELNSYAGRLIYEFDEESSAMISASYVKDPEEHDSDLDHINRYSASYYSEYDVFSEIKFNNTFIFGLVNGLEHISALRSFVDEFLIHAADSPHNYWGRLEVLERAPAQLGFITTDPLDPQYVTALTLGYTHKWKVNEQELGLGFAATKNFLPSDFDDVYGDDPWASKIFVQWSAMKMNSR